VFVSTLKRLFFRTEKRELPPRHLLKIIGSDDSNYARVGQEFFVHLTDLVALSPGDRVLEVGCGVGRIAQPLRTFIAPPGSYDGFDIMRDAIEWCRQNITNRDPHIRFHHADISNGFYNKHGKQTAGSFEFPWSDNSFDVVFLTSVFTHLLPDEVDHYLSEIARVLSGDGRCLVTYFLLNQGSRRRLREGATSYHFDPDRHPMSPLNRKVPEIGLAYDEQWVVDLHAKHRLPIQAPIHYGSWSGSPHHLSYQDIVIARRA
jgi:SAM-dependent methyltransferase